MTQPSTTPPLSRPSDIVSSGSGHVTSLIETLQPPPPGSPTLQSAAGSRSLLDMLRAQTTALSASQSKTSTLTGAVLGGVDLSLAAMVLGASSSVTASPVASPPATRRQPPPDLRILVTTDSPERAPTVTSPGRSAMSSPGRGAAHTPGKTATQPSCFI